MIIDLNKYPFGIETDDDEGSVTMMYSLYNLENNHSISLGSLIGDDERVQFTNQLPFDYSMCENVYILYLYQKKHQY